MIQTILTPFLALWLIGVLLVLGLRLQFRSQVETQARLDRCVREQALDLRDSQRQIAQINIQMDVLRKSKLAIIGVGAVVTIATAGMAAPAAGSLGYDAWKGVDVLLKIEVARQEIIHAKHLWRFLRWETRQGCDSQGGLWGDLSPLHPLYPSFSWKRPPKDWLGLRPLEWKGPKTMHLVLQSNHRVSHARIELEHENKSKSWTAYWAAGTDFH